MSTSPQRKKLPRSDVIDGIGGQTPVYHAIASIGDANFPLLEQLCRRASPQVDVSVRATFRQFVKVWATSVTPLEFAAQAAPEATSHNRSKAAAEIALLRSMETR